MSSLWTPGGEHPVGRPGDPPAAPPPGAPQGSGGDDGDAPDALDGLDGLDGLDERAAAMAAELDEVRAQLAQVPATEVVANHAMGLFELAAIHLSQQPPNLGDAVLAIDAMASLVEGLGERLGAAAPTLADALAQIRMAFVQVKAGAGPAPG